MPSRRERPQLQKCALGGRVGGGLAVHNYRNVGLGGVGEGVCAWMFRPKFLRLLMQVFCKWGTAGGVGAHMPSRGERPQSVGWW